MEDDTQKTLAATESSERDIVWVLDVLGSMSWTPLEETKKSKPRTGLCM